MGFKSDIEIAQEAKPQDIREIAKKLGLTEDDLELYGKYKAKVDYNLLKKDNGGKKAKLILTKLVIEECDVLLLDEPTRNVSPLSNPVIRSVLRQFKGTIISVSHDRKYIDEVISDIYLLTHDGLMKIEKDYIWQ